MLFLDKPYISELLLKTIEENHLPVLKTSFAEEATKGRDIQLINQSDAIKIARSKGDLRILTTSENSITWINEHFSFLDLPKTINAFKDKLKFRQRTAILHPEFIFSSVASTELESLDTENLPYPFIIKPAKGFFSMGVHLVNNASDWQRVKNTLRSDIEQDAGLYPLDVMDSSVFIIEQFLEGDEFAIDAYYDDHGEVVILNIFQHLFSSGEDVSDRIYITSKELIEENLLPFKQYLTKLGEIFDVKNFPVHVELRRDDEGGICAIEVNPLRFGGWCTTADMTWFSYGFNSYLFYLNQERPNWQKILEDKTGITYAIVVLDNSTGIPAQEIKSFDFEKAKSNFECVMETRQIDHLEYPLFGFMFTKTANKDFSALTNMLSSNLKEFILT